MTTRAAAISPQVYARLAGWLYLLDVLLSICGGLLTSSISAVSGDAAATARNVQAFEMFFRLGLVSDLASSVLLIVVTLLLYELLKRVHSGVALLMVAFVLAGVSIAMLNTLNPLAALQVLSGSEYLKTFSVDQLQSLALLFLQLHNRGSDLAYTCWGMALLTLGYLIFQSGFLPRILGVVLMLAGLCYLSVSLATVLGYNQTIGKLAGVGEIAFIAWLLVKGVNVEQWQRRALKSAT